MSGKIGRVMGEFARGTLHSGSKRGPKVKDRRQAVAIAMSEARRAGEDVPRRRKRSGVVHSLLREGRYRG